MKMKEFTDTELEQEQWRDIDGYDGMYQVSDIGRVRSLKYGKVRVLKAQKDKDGYLRVSLYKDNKEKHFFVHRLVAQAFIENDDETKTQINHIDECKQNNRLWNLEYCTAQYNTTYNDIHHRRKQFTHSKYRRNEIKYLYNQNLTYQENLELFRANGIECCRGTVYNLRRDLNLKPPQPKRSKVKDLYDPNLTYKQNVELFRANGIECSTMVVKSIRRDLKLEKPKTKRDEIRHLYDTELSINDNLKVLKEQGIECSIATLYRIRQELGLSKQK